MRFTVVLPTYNRPQALERCLGSLQELQFDPEQFEIIVVDDGGSCDLTPVVAKFTGGPDLQLLRQANAGPGAARNLGARKARGQYLAFIDDDCLATPTWLHDYEQALKKDREALWGGSVLTDAHQNLYCQAAQAVLDLAQSAFNRDEAQARFFSSNNFVVPTHRFLELRGFMEVYFRVCSEDREFCDRWAIAGLRLRSLRGGAIYHQPNLGLGSYAGMYFRYGRGAYRFQRIRHLRGSGTMHQDLNFHRQLPFLLGQATRRVPLQQRLMLLGLLGIWQVANAAGFFSELMAHKLQPAKHSTDPTTEMMHHQIPDRLQANSQSGCRGKMSITGEVGHEIADP